MTEPEYNALCQVYEVLCSGRAQLARELLEHLLGIETKETA
jgi:hypothetical protein